MKVRNLCFILFAVAGLAACQSAEDPSFKADDPSYVHRSVQKLTDVMVYDIFSPPVASRIYAYANIAGYEALVPGYPEYQSLAGQINELEASPKPEPGVEYCYPLASIHAFLSVGKNLIFSEEMINEYEKEVYGKYHEALDQEVYDRSLAFGEAIEKHIMTWASSDNYKQTRTFPKFSVTEAPGRWQPTPPDYMDGIEPHWKKIRTLVLDSCSQFRPAPPTSYSMEEGSPFYQEAKEVYDTGVNLTEEQSAIASFWDCNPYVSHHQGHVMFATKKITPGGHWMGITSIVSQKDSSSMIESVENYTMVSIALFDGFISCWDEKYRSNLIRPETVINANIDEDWMPLLQTPPFPEYPSGHSVISTSAATALTSILGDTFHFVDSTEVSFGLPPREFDSFLDASQEAAISRLYGGIHYMPAIENGVDMGRKVGALVVERIHPRKENKLASK